MRKVINRWNYKPDPGATITGKTMTLQNESLSVAEMLNQLITNQTIQENEGVWGEEEPDIDDPDLQEIARVDLAERDEIVQELKHKIANLEMEWKLEAELKKQETEAKKVDQKGKDQDSN